MDKNNEYYGVIEQLIRQHKKFNGYDSIIDEIIDDVYKHSESVISAVNDKNVVETYLTKVINTSIITVPKRLNFQPASTIKHSNINLSTYISPVENKENDLQKEEIITVNKNLVDDMINSSKKSMEEEIAENNENNELLSILDNQEEAFDIDADAAEEVLPDITEENTEILDISENFSNDETVEMNEQPSIDELNLEVETVPVEQTEVSFEQDIDENSQDLLPVEESKEEISDLNENSEAESLDSVEIDFSELSIVQETPEENFIDTEANLSLQENDEETLDIDIQDNTETQETSESEKLELADSEEENILDNELILSEAINEETGNDLDISSAENEELISFENNFIEPSQNVDIINEENENLVELSVDFDNNLSIDDSTLVQDEDISLDINPEYENLEISENISSLELPVDNYLSEADSEDSISFTDIQEPIVPSIFDYSIFNYSPVLTDTSAKNDYAELIKELDEENPDLKILQVYELKYFQKMNISDIANHLDISNDKVVEALNKMVSAVQES